jgi:hypothetical protein
MRCSEVVAVDAAFRECRFWASCLESGSEWLLRLLGALVFCAAFLGALHGPFAALAADAVTVEAEFRGCPSARECRFWAASLESKKERFLRVRPDGGFSDLHDTATAFAVRNRLNALMSNMIHQYKRIELRDLRSLGDGMFAATIIVDGMELRADPVLLDLTQHGAEHPR